MNAYIAFPIKGRLIKPFALVIEGSFFKTVRNGRRNASPTVSGIF